MATYFHGTSEIQGDGLQTLILMNRGFGGYSDGAQQPPPTNFVFLNSAGNSPNPPTIPHAPPSQTQQLVGFPLHAATTLHHQQPEIPSLHGGFAPRSHYNVYNSIDTTARDFTRAPQGLSLSLSSQQTTTHWTTPMISPTSGDDIRVSGRSPATAVSGISNGVLSSNYLKAAQELLDEAVNVGKAIKNRPNKRTEGSLVSMTVAGEGASGGAYSSAKPGELTTSERHEIQTKKAKLVNMLDEVERRYRHYHHQIQIVISWFEQAAGIGSAKPYTNLALETISKQFRCLKDTLVEQIRATNKSLAEEEDGKAVESSRLKFIDHQLRQQRALHNLGMIQPNAWRPQRGLPERAVSVLRAWLFEHFLHPYPKDTDKIMLAKQTGLTRSQVSNWFINARVRLWKPMVEEMYLEEVKEQEHNGSEERTTSKGENNEDLAAKKRGFKEVDGDHANQNPAPEISVSPSSTSPTGITLPNQSDFSLIRAPQMEGSPRKQSRTTILQSPSMAMHMNVKPGEEEDHQQLAMSFNGGFGGYTIAEHFPASYSGNGVSLTLGLQHCESLSISDDTHQAFLQANQRRVEIDESNDQFGGLNTVPSSSHSASLYEAMNLQNRKRFAAQLLPDFVA